MEEAVSMVEPRDAPPEGQPEASAAVFSSEVSVEEIASPGGFARLFPRPGGLEIEIGCGKGRFLIRSAMVRPDTDFLGIERAGRFFRVALDRANRRRLPNVKLVRADALFLFHQALPPGCARAVHVLFPDPWPKKRHHKRRLFGPRFLEGAGRVLLPGGVLNVATDHEEYFSFLEEAVRESGIFTRAERFELENRVAAGETGLTNYEVKYRLEWRVIRQATWISQVEPPHGEIRNPEG
jgi:tRNA (guanine-N7-)-methyltransferase